MFNSKCPAQISPPGLGETNSASWLAIGLEQDLGKENSITSTTYFGLGRMSTPENHNLFNKQAIYVLNEELAFRFKKKWKYAFAFSYRWQNNYQSTPPYARDNPNGRQEIRLSSRLTYLNHKHTYIDYSFSFRPELRFFYNPDFMPAPKDMQIRSRFRGKLAFNLNSLETHRLITTAELFFSTTRNTHWSRIDYQEARLCFYYAVTLPKQKLELHLGYMNNLRGKSIINGVNHLVINIILKNPFEK